MVNDKEIKVTRNSKKDQFKVPTKIVIRKLPPLFTEEELKGVIAPLPEDDYFKFVPCDKDLGPHSYSRAYINFVNDEEISSFTDRFDGYVFLDQKGNEYPALVEYAPFQKVAKSAVQRKDARCGTVDEDPDYVAFLEQLQNPEVVSLPQIESILEEIENLEKEASANGGKKIKTPLLEYLEHRSAERLRAGERRKKKELERKKLREEERKKRKEAREYKKTETEPWKEREKENHKKREEERSKWSKTDERGTEKFKDRIDSSKSADFKYRLKDEKHWVKHHEEVLDTGKGFNKSKTKRYSEARKREDKFKKPREKEDGEGTQEKRTYKTHEKDTGRTQEKDTSTVQEKYTSTTQENDTSRAHEKVKSGMQEKDTSITQKDASRIQQEKDATSDVNVAKADISDHCQRLKEPKDYDTKNTEKSDTLKSINEEEVKRLPEESSRTNAGTEQSNKDVEEGKENKDENDRKDPRTERKIRNKDRPTMQLYRPGQSRFKGRCGKDGEGHSGSESPLPSEKGRVGGTSPSTEEQSGTSLSQDRDSVSHVPVKSATFRRANQD